MGESSKYTYEGNIQWTRGHLNGIRTLLRNMENQAYQKLLFQYLKNPTPQEEDYEKWATQFREHNGHIYREDRRVVPAYETKWSMSMFHDDPTQAHQNADIMYYYISKRYLWQNMRKDIKEYTKTYFQCQQRGSMR